MISLLLGHFGGGNGGDGVHAADHGGDFADGHAADHGGDFADGHAGDHGGMEYGVEGHGHGATSTGSAAVATFHFPFFSPLALATTLGAMGSYGLIAKYGLRVPNQTSLFIAIPAACVTAYVITYIGWRLAASSIGSSQIRIADLRGASAEVITPIPAGGVGEVAAVVNGERYTGPAREASGKAVPRGARVTVRNLVGTTLIVDEIEPPKELRR